MRDEWTQEELDEIRERAHAHALEIEKFELPAPGRERMYGRFDGIPPQAATQRNIANRRRVIE